MHASDEVVRFGAFALLPRRRALLFGGAPVALGARAFDLLAALVARRGALATKDALMAEVWAGSVVDENNLAAQVSALRKVLARDPAMARCLQTVPGRGYRFVAEFHEGAAGAAEGEAPSLVVLPFDNLSGDAEQGWFAQGLSQTIATDLSRIAGLVVIGSATAATFGGGRLDARQVGGALGIGYVLAGSVQRIGPTLRINARLVDARSGAQLWSERMDGEAADLLPLQDRITGRIANALGREIFVAAARDRAGRTTDPTAADLVMRGIAADNRPQSLEVLRAQEALFAQAVALDPGNAEAQARLARAILLQATQVHASAPPADMLARGVAAAERAVALNPGNARAHCAMGLVHVLHRDFARAVLANEAAIALDRNFALAHNNLGNSQVHLGDGAAALPAAEAALRLDPRGPQRGAFLTTMGFARLVLGEVAEAGACFARALVANPRQPRAQVGAAVALALGGDAAAARQAVAELLALVPGYRLSATMDGCPPGAAPRYRRFFEDILRPGAALAGLPV